MPQCKKITDMAFADLSGLRVLDISGCTQPRLTGCAISNLTSLHTLVMYGCTNVVDGAFMRLHNLRILNVGECPQITDSIFRFIPELSLLFAAYRPGLIKDKTTVTSHLRNLRLLVTDLDETPQMFADSGVNVSSMDLSRLRQKLRHEDHHAVFGFGHSYAPETARANVKRFAVCRFRRGFSTEVIAPAPRKETATQTLRKALLKAINFAQQDPSQE
jgi:hypothetical protein